MRAKCRKLKFELNLSGGVWLGYRSWSSTSKQRFGMTQSMRVRVFPIIICTTSKIAPIFFLSANKFVFSLADMTAFRTKNTKLKEIPQVKERERKFHSRQAASYTINSRAYCSHKPHDV